MPCGHIVLVQHPRLPRGGRMVLFTARDPSTAARRLGALLRGRGPARVLWHMFVTDVASVRAAWRAHRPAGGRRPARLIRLPVRLAALSLRRHAAGASPAVETVIDPATGLFRDPRRPLEGPPADIAEAIAREIARGVRGSADSYALIFHAFPAACLTAVIGARLAACGVPALYTGEVLREVVARVWRVRPPHDQMRLALGEAARAEAPLALARLLTRVQPDQALVHVRNYLGHPQAAMLAAVETYLGLIRRSGIWWRSQGLLSPRDLDVLLERARHLPRQTGFARALDARGRRRPAAGQA